MCEIRARSVVSGTLAVLVGTIALAGCGPKTQSGPAAPQPPAAQAPQPAPAAPVPQPAPATPPAQPPATQPATPAPAQSTPSTPPAAPTAPATQPASSAAPGQATQSAAPAASPAPAAPVVARVDGETPGTRLEVQELKRSTNTVMLRFAVINDSQKPFDLGPLSPPVVDSKTVSSVYLIDAVGKKKYLTIHDSEGHCVCSGGLGTLDAGDRINLWAKFPAPPAAVQKITVVVPHFTPMDDVPISQ